MLCCTVCCTCNTPRAICVRPPSDCLSVLIRRALFDVVVTGIETSLDSTELDSIGLMLCRTEQIQRSKVLFLQRRVKRSVTRHTQVTIERVSTIAYNWNFCLINGECMYCAAVFRISFISYHCQCAQSV